MADTKPPVASHSFPPPFAPPPAKRPRLSPPPSSQFPQSPSTLVGYSFPDTQSPFSNSFNEPLPVARPANAPPTAANAGPKGDKATDITELGDLINAAGINLKDEEAAFFSSGYKSHPSANDYFPVAIKRREGEPFEVWAKSQTVSQLIEIGHKSGILSATVTPAEYENNLKHFVASVSDASGKSKHLTDPFLLGNAVRSVLDKRQSESGVKLRGEPSDISINGASNFTGQMARLPDGSAVVSARSSVIPQKSDIANILSLVSLAAEERVRSLLEDAYTASRARVYGAGGVVPPEWSDLAIGKSSSEEAMVVEKSITGTAWDALPDSAVSPNSKLPIKAEGGDDTQNSLSILTDGGSEQKTTIKFPPAIPKLLIKIGDDDLEAERKRIAARKKRKADKEGREKEATTASAADPVTAAAEATPTSTAPTPINTSMPPPPTTPSEVSTPTAGAKRKKGDKGGKLHFSDQAQRQAAASTAQLFVGNFGKKYSWLTSASSAPGTPKSGLSTGAGMSDRLVAQNTVKKEATPLSTPSASKEDPSLESKKTYKNIGLVKEPPGVQLKDILGVLERNGKEKKALLRGYAKLDKEK